MKRVCKDLIFLIVLKTFQLLVLDWRPTMETHVFLRVCGELSPHSLPSRAGQKYRMGAEERGI